MAWQSNAPWRQGDFLALTVTDMDGAAIDLETMTASVVIISHSCDIVREIEIEPYIEVIPIRTIQKLDGNLTNAKNPRKLHLALASDSRVSYIELDATKKRHVHKEKFACLGKDTTLTLTPQSLHSMQVWLAARYRRAALPDDFNMMLKEKRVSDRINQILKPSSDINHAIYFALEPQEIDESGSIVTPYAISIYLIYSEDGDGMSNAASAAELSERISSMLTSVFFDHHQQTWVGMQLERCIPVSENEMNYAMSRRLLRWNNDHLRAHPGSSDSR